VTKWKIVTAIWPRFLFAGNARHRNMTSWTWRHKYNSMAFGAWPKQFDK